jgi:hypothetical protein
VFSAATAGTFQATAPDGAEQGSQPLNLVNPDEITVLLDAEVKITAIDLPTVGLPNVITELDEELTFG